MKLDKYENTFIWVDNYFGKQKWYGKLFDRIYLSIMYLAIDTKDMVKKILSR